ncbi:MAG: xylose isomerase [Spirochaetaceae bacterium]|nr:MAG: xylose isomerase [Spirochaetaceae bacterium]
MSQFKFSVGPWNVHEGADVFGPPVRPTIAFAEKLAGFKQIGFSAVQFHDDDVVPEIESKSASQITATARKVKQMLDDQGMAAEFVAPRLWESARTIDGAFTSNSQADRDYAIERSLRAVDICREVGCDLLGFWYAREGTLCSESKDMHAGIHRMIEGLNRILDYDGTIRIFIEPKPNEPIDRSFVPTMGHAMALSAETIDPPRVGGLVESAHAILAGLDPANEMAFALALGKLFGVHFNDQNGMRYDQDKAFGVENLRQAFNQVRVLVENRFGSKGEYIGLDVKAMRTQKAEACYEHLKNSLQMVELLEQKVGQFDYQLQRQLIEARDYEGLEMYVMKLLLGG